MCKTTLTFSLAALLTLAGQVQPPPAPSAPLPAQDDYTRQREKFIKRHGKVLQPMLKQIFEPPAVEIQRKEYLIVDGKQVLVSSDTIWFSKGELFVRVQKLADKDEGTMMYNIVTREGKIYMWMEGEKEGHILTRFEDDTLACTRYLCDPSWILSGLYGFHYLQRQSKFTKTDLKEGTLIMFPKLTGRSDLGIVVAADPLWFSELRTKDGNAEGGTTFSRPKVLEAVPERARQLPDGVKFKESGLTLETIMVFL